MLNASQKRVLLIASIIGAMFVLGIIIGFVSPPANEYASYNYEYRENQQSSGGLLSLIVAIDALLDAHESTLTVISTIAIAAFTGTLWWVTLGLLNAAEQQKSDMRESLGIAKQAADAASDSAKLARADFSSTHRPKLIVRRIYFKSDRMIAYEVANIGAMEAEILSAKSMVCFDKLPVGSPNVGAPTFISAHYVVAGSYFEFVHGITDNKVREQFDFRGVDAHETVKPIIYFLGHIAYNDSLGVSRRTAFYRRYDFYTESFMPVPNADQDYEHAD